MRGRAVGLVLLGLGAFLLAGALVVRLMLVPAVVKLPLDQKAAPVAQATDVSYFDLQAGEQLRGLEGEVVQKVQGDPSADGVGDDVAVWNFGSTLLDDDGNMLNAYTYAVCIDRREAVARDCESTHIDYDRDAEIEGLTLTFPFGTEKRDYDYFNPTTRQAFPAAYEGTEELEGLEVYRFVQTIPETVIRQTDIPGSMAGSSEPSVPADVVYSNERTMWVEPTSGVVVTAEEHPDTVLRTADGDTVATVLAGDFAGTEETVAAGVDRAVENRDKIDLVSRVIPLTMAGLGLVVLLLAVFLLVRRSRTTTETVDGEHTGRHTRPVAQV